jgi:hypothetical protein
MTRRKCWHDATPLATDHSTLPTDWRDGRRLVATFSGDGLVARKNEHELLVLRTGSGDAKSRTVATFPSSPSCVYDAAVDDSGALGVYETNPTQPAVVKSHDATAGQTNYHRVRALNARNAEFWETREWTP